MQPGRLLVGRVRDGPRVRAQVVLGGIGQTWWCAGSDLRQALGRTTRDVDEIEAANSAAACGAGVVVGVILWAERGFGRMRGVEAHAVSGPKIQEIV